jgi:hypothetical protein
VGDSGPGNVRPVEGPWNGAFVGELEVFPAGRYSDAVDAASLAFNKLALMPIGGGGGFGAGGRGIHLTGTMGVRLER